MRTEYVVDVDTAGRLARASVLYRVTTPAIYGAVLVEVAIAVAFVATDRLGWGIALAAFAASLPVVLWLQAPSLARTMQRRGYRPATILTVDWDADTFTVTTPDGAGTHRYDHVSSAREVAGAVVLRIRGARVLLLPAEVVPAGVRPRLSSRET